MGGFAFLVIQVGATVLAQVAPATVPDRAIVEQKRALVARILAEAPIATSVARGESTDAREKLASAAQLHSRAEVHLEKGEVAAADKLLNEAMRQVSSARALVPNPALRSRSRKDALWRARRKHRSAGGIVFSKCRTPQCLACRGGR